MSTFYATFRSWNNAQSAVHEMLGGGVRPDDLSLVACSAEGDVGEMQERPNTVGDATAFVGRPDDPARDFPVPRHADISELTSLEQSRIEPIDTSDSDTDVDSVDQMEDSQEEFERMMRPKGGIAYADHERDDLALTVTTGFPTVPVGLDLLPVGDLEQEEQLEDSAEILEIPGFGIIIGGGELATAALDFAKADGSCHAEGLAAQLREEGVDEDTAREIQASFQRGEAVLAVTITPGEIVEEAVEEIADRHGCHNYGLFDSPRY